jgi:hypothetical protein
MRVADGKPREGSRGVFAKTIGLAFPMTLYPYVTTIPLHPMALNPGRRGIGWFDPITVDPHIGTVAVPVMAFAPNESFTR